MYAEFNGEIRYSKFTKSTELWPFIVYLVTFCN